MLNVLLLFVYDVYESIVVRGGHECGSSIVAASETVWIGKCDRKATRAAATSPQLLTHYMYPSSRNSHTALPVSLLAPMRPAYRNKLVN